MPSATTRFVRTVHDVGVAAWFGASLVRALDRRTVPSGGPGPAGPAARTALRWSQWLAPSTAVGMHVIGAVVPRRAEGGRVVGRSVSRVDAAVKDVLTGLAVASTCYAGVLRTHLAAEVDASTSFGIDAVRTARRRARSHTELRILQWATPALTAGLILLGVLRERPPPARIDHLDRTTRALAVTLKGRAVRS